MKFRETLRFQYIAAIVIALLAADAIRNILATFLAPLEVWTSHRMELLFGQRSVMQEAGPLLHPPVLILRAVTALLYLAAAALVFRWIYWERGQTIDDPELLDTAPEELDRPD